MLAIRRPYRAGCAVLLEGHLLRFAAVGWDGPYLRFAFAQFLRIFFVLVGQVAFALRDECQPVAIGRPRGAVRNGGAGRELPRLATFNRNYPDRGAILIGAFV